MKCFQNVISGMFTLLCFVTNIDRIHDIALNNQIWSQMLRTDLRPTPDIFSPCLLPHARVWETRHQLPDFRISSIVPRWCQEPTRPRRSLVEFVSRPAGDRSVGLGPKEVRANPVQISERTERISR